MTWRSRAFGGRPAAALVLCTALFGLSACGSEPAPEPDERPNVLFVLLDTLRADRLGSYGSERGLTPELDRLAAESLRFSDCWATSSWTLPSIATLFTSNHGAQHGAWLADMRLGEGIDTLAELFRGAGYRTGAVTGGGWVKREFGLDRGFETFVDDVEPFADATELTRGWLAANRQKPWFFFLHTYEIHAPYEPPQDALSAVRAEHGEVLAGRELDPFAFQDDVADNGGTAPESVARALEALYDEEIRYTDRVLGQLLDELRANGVLDNTVVVVTSDHGEEFGEHGLLGHSDTLYVEQLHVPLLVRLPGGARAGEVDGRSVSQLDLAPTVLDAAGLAGRAANSTFEGRSLLGGERPSPVYATRNHDEAGLLSALRNESWVWIEGEYRWSRQTSGRELYDLSTDPAQTRESSAQQPERARDLAEALDALVQRFGVPRADSSKVEVDEATRARLEELGYYD